MTAVDVKLPIDAKVSQQGCLTIYRSTLDEIPKNSITDKCIVLDLDETLVHTFDDFSSLINLKIFSDPKLLDIRSKSFFAELDDVTERKGTGAVTKIWGVTRPHLREFFIFCFSYFKVVAVWSAGRRRYVEEVINFVTKDIKLPHVIFTYDDCKVVNKNLTKPLQEMVNKTPGLDKYMNMNNTFIIDDRHSVFFDANPNNGIIIPAYQPVAHIDALRVDDIALTQLMYWFSIPAVKTSTDVKTLSKDGIFTTSIADYQKLLGLTIS